jgi:uncharacterized protein (TIGR00730 family)
MKTISIFCGSKDTNNNETIKLEIYKLLSNIDPNKYSVAYGGGSSGYMGDIYTGCKENNLLLTSINCYRWKEAIDPSFKNYREYFHHDLSQRQNHLLFIGDIYIVFPGGCGTIFEAMQAITTNDIKESCKPIYFLNIDNYFNHLFNMLDYGREQGTIVKSNEELNITICNNSKELLEKLI